MKRFQGICDSLEGRERKKKNPVYMLQLTTPPPSYHSGDVKPLQVEKLGGWDETERKADGLAVLGYSLPPSGVFAHLKRHFRHAYPPHHHHHLSLSFSLSVWHAYISI